MNCDKINDNCLHTMNWTFENFKTELKELKPEIREKALEIAKYLMISGKYSNESIALKEAIKQAEEWFLNLEG